MAVIPVTTMHNGIDFRNDPVAVQDGAVVESIGFDLSKEGSLTTNPVFSSHDLGSRIPAGKIDWIETVSVKGQAYVLAVVGESFYVDGTKKTGASVGSPFKATSVMDQIYIVSSAGAARYDTSQQALYQLGITAPISVPTFSAAPNVYQSIDDFEGVLTDWIANAVNCVVASDAVVYKVGSKSMKLTFADAATGSSYDNIAVNCAVLSDGSVSPDDDLVHFYLRVDDIKKLDELYIQFDLAGTSFDSDFYAYSIVLPGEAAFLGYGKESATEEVLLTDFDAVFGTSFSKKIKTTSVPGVVDVLNPQSYQYWKRNDLINLQSGVWCLIEIPKSYFVRYGTDTTKTWADVKAVKVKATTTGACVINIDDLKIVGGGDLKGDYWFMYAWGRQDNNGSLVNWSSVARSAKQVLISGPVTFNRQKVTYASRPLSSDSQVNCGLVYILGGDLQDWYQAFIVADNTTTSDTQNVNENELSRLGVAFRNEPAPGGSDIIYKYGRLWICGMLNQPAGIACSEVTSDGDVLLEAWPPTNVWLADGESSLFSISDMGSQTPLVVRGQNGEYLLSMADATDVTTVQALSKLSSYGVLNRTSKVPFENGELFPSINTFVVGTTEGSKAILPEFSSVIRERNMQDAVGITSGWISYFSFTDHNEVNRTVKVDRLREALRVSTLTNKKCECLILHSQTKKIYAVHNGTVYCLEKDYDGEEYDLNIVSKGFTAEGGMVAAWQRIEFAHNTGGQWLRCHVYVDGKEVGYWPFQSSRKRESSYWFGPTRGNYFQFAFKGQYRNEVKIDMPIRIYYV